jgi:hypothetical protein
MINLVFKSTEAAFEYAQKFFTQTKLSTNASFIGIVRLIDAREKPTGYVIEIFCEAGIIFKKQITMPVAAIKHPELLSEIRDNDLVIFGPDDISGKIPSGYVIHKLEPEIDAETQTFKICTEKRKELGSFNTATERGLKHWKHEIDYKYGLLLAESEMLEGEGFIHFCQTDRNKLCASWDIQNQSWQVNVERSLLEGLSFTTPKRFEEIVFAGEDYTKNYYRKQYLIEYLLFGINIGETKTLTKEVDGGAKIEFSLDARTWNEMLIGNAVGVEGGICKYFEQNSEEERVLTFGLLCKEWGVNIEIVFDDYDDYEQHSFPIKDFGGYYS